MWSGGCGSRMLPFGCGGPDAMVIREDKVELDYGQLEWPPVVPLILGLSWLLGAEVRLIR